jgi:hypothetical protein
MTRWTVAKKFYTDKDIEELFHSGVKTLQVDDEVVLTDIAYEKAIRLGFELVMDRADAPPAAPVRPYLSEKNTPPLRGKPKVDSVSEPLSQPKQDSMKVAALEKRIRERVAAQLGNQVDPQLLDTIIKRTLKVTGFK